MNTFDLNELSPVFEGVWFVDDTNVHAAATIRGDRLLDAGAARTILTSEFSYTQVRQPDGRSWYDSIEDGALKRHYVFTDPEAPDNAAHMVDFVFSVTQANGVIGVLPQMIRRGSEADFVASVSYNCCTKGGRTAVYSDTSAARGVFMNVASSGGDVRAEIQKLWRNMQAVVLDHGGQAALAHLVLDMTGRCGEGHGQNHALRADHRKGSVWKGYRLNP